MTVTTAPAAVSSRRGEILAIASNCFAERGFAATTVREIADAAGILSGSLYHHFDSKESMVDELVRGALDRILDAYRGVISRTPEPEHALVALVRAAFGAVAADRATVTVMVNEWNLLLRYPRFAYLREVEEETEALWTGVFERGIASSAFRDGLDPRMLYRMMRDAIWVTVRWFRADGPDSPELLADRYLAVWLPGILRATGAATAAPTGDSTPGGSGPSQP